MSNIDKYEDVLDSRDIQERINELTEDIKTEQEPKLVEEMQEELDSLTALKQEYIDSFGESSWGFGAQFINADYFEEYAEEFCKDVGYISNDLPWFISNAIDWAEVAETMQQDYTEIDFDGVIFYTQEA